MFQPGGAPKLILASASVARRRLLEAAGLTLEVSPARIDESEVKAAARARGETAAETALLLADLKAAQVARAVPEALVIGADQLLVCEHNWFDKPPSLQAARIHLLALRGRTHVLFTAVCCHRGGGAVWQHLAAPSLAMRYFSEPFLDAYLAGEGEAVLGSVGAYRLEGLGALLFDRIEGDLFAIQGLPLLPLLAFLRRQDAILD